MGSLIIVEQNASLSFFLSRLWLLLNLHYHLSLKQMIGIGRLHDHHLMASLPFREISVDINQTLYHAFVFSRLSEFSIKSWVGWERSVILQIDSM